MRIALCAVPLAFLAACGGPQSGQANNRQANGAAPPRATANEMAMIAVTRVSGADAARIMHERHEAMEGLGKAMKALHRELDSAKPDIDVIRAQTATMASVAAKIPGFFPQGTGPDAGKTRAKAEIWRQPDVFNRRSQEYLSAARAIDAAAKAGDISKVMALHENVDKACKACHDPFRAPEH